MVRPDRRSTYYCRLAAPRQRGIDSRQRNPDIGFVVGIWHTIIRAPENEGSHSIQRSSRCEVPPSEKKTGRVTGTSVQTPISCAMFGKTTQKKEVPGANSRRRIGCNDTKTRMPGRFRGKRATETIPAPWPVALSSKVSRIGP